MSETLSQLVKRLRKQTWLTQKTLAEKSGLSTSFITKLERDDKKMALATIRTSTLEQLADGLGLSKDSPDRQLLIELALERNQREKTSSIAPLLEKIPDVENGSTSNREVDLSKPGVFTQMEDVADCAVWMLSQAPELDEIGEEEISITTQGSSAIFIQLGQEKRWADTIRSVMQERKWNVVTLYRMTGNLERAFEVIQEIRNLSICPTQHIARQFRQIGALRPTYSLLIVPRIGGLLALSTHNPAVVDSAFFYPDTKEKEFEPHIKMLTNHFDLLYAETTQLARTYQPRSSEWEDTMTAACQLEAEELLANNSLDSTNMPPVLYDELLQKSLSLENVHSAMAFRRQKTHHIQRREAFERNVRSFRYLTIIPKHSFENALGLSKDKDKEGQCCYPVEYARNPSQYITVDKRLAIEHIEYLIRDLRRYENYEIALIEDDHPHAKDLLYNPWLVKDEAVVLTATFTERGVIASEMELIEPSIVRSYRHEFLTIWSELTDPDKTKQKDKVIEELAGLLEKAKSKTDASYG